MGSAVVREQDRTGIAAAEACPAYAVASHRVDSQWRYALALQNQYSVVRFPQGVTRVYLSFFLGRSWLVWPHFFLRQLTARGCRRA